MTTQIYTYELYHISFSGCFYAVNDCHAVYLATKLCIVNGWFLKNVKNEAGDMVFEIESDDKT